MGSMILKHIKCDGLLLFKQFQQFRFLNELNFKSAIDYD